MIETRKTKRAVDGVRVGDRQAGNGTWLGVFSDRRPLSQIGGLRAYLRQIAWSLRWRYSTDQTEKHPMLKR